MSYATQEGSGVGRDVPHVSKSGQGINHPTLREYGVGLPARFAQKAPFVYFGGKSKAAGLVWDLLGDVPHFVEPFCGSAAVLLARPHPCNRAYFSETINDADGLICNLWRSIQLHPDETAEWASWPVSEYDKQARQIAALQWTSDPANVEKLAGTWDFCNPQVAGFWLYGLACQIGSIRGPWTACPETGRIVKIKDLPGVSRDRPFVGSDGQGVNTAAMRQRGVGEPPAQEEATEADFHPFVMPRLRAWMALLSARLRHVRIIGGDWKRCCTTGVLYTINVRQGDGPAGVFLDPPYSNAVRAGDCYRNEHDSGHVAEEAREWARKAGKDPRCRIVLAGYSGEGHESLLEDGWTEHEWYRPGHLTGGMGNIDGTSQQHLERLWASPHTLPVGAAAPLGGLFGGEEDEE